MVKGLILECTLKRILTARIINSFLNLPPYVQYALIIISVFFFLFFFLSHFVCFWQILVTLGLTQPLGIKKCHRSKNFIKVYYILCLEYLMSKKISLALSLSSLSIEYENIKFFRKHLKIYYGVSRFYCNSKIFWKREQ